MKMVKKILLGLAATASIMALFGCKMNDDPENAIKGFNNNYSIDYTNETGSEYRAYESTNFKHAGALVKIKIDNAADCGNSKMGVIFELKENATNKKAVDFYIIGVGTNNSQYNFYVSKYTSIVNIRDKNFGAPSNGSEGPNGEKEVEYIPLSGTKISDLPEEFYVYCKAKIDGSYEFALLKGTPTDSTKMDIDKIDITDLPSGVELITLPTSTKKNGCTISGNIGKIPNVFDAVTKDSDIQQNKLALYARIDKDATLKGSWKFCGTYLEAEEVEE